MRAIKTDNRHLQKRIHITFVALLPFYAGPWIKSIRMDDLERND